MLFTGKLHCLKVFDRSLHGRSSDPICVQDFRPVPPTVFEIQGFKLKNDNNRIGEMAISPMLMVQFKVDIHVDLSYHSAVSNMD